MALSVDPQEFDRVSGDRPWAAPRSRDLLLVVAAILAVAGAVVQSLDTDTRSHVVLIGSIEAGDLKWVLLCLATVMLLLWSLSRCWLAPSWRFASTVFRVAITLPLVWLLFLASLGAILGAAFASHGDFIRVGADDEGEYLLMVEPALGDANATLLHGGPMRYDVVGEALVQCWNELTSGTLHLVADGSEVRLTAGLSRSCLREQGGKPFEIVSRTD